MSQVSYGTITITDTTDKTVYIAYASNAQGANFSPNPASNLTYVGINVSTAQSMPSAEDPGWSWSEYIGTDGVSVTSIADIYYLKVNTNPTKRADDTPLPSAVDSVDTWSLQVPTYVTNGEYWTSTATTLSSGHIVYSTPVKDLGLTNSNSKAETALRNANIAKTATDLLGGHFIYKSTNTEKSGVITTPSGAGVIQTIADDPANWGYNTWIGSNGIQLRRGEAADATLDANGLKLLKGGIEAGTSNESNFIYLSTNDYPLRQFVHTSDSSIDASKEYYELNNNEFVLVEEPEAAAIANYYEISVDGIAINGHVPTEISAENRDIPWRQIIGNNFGVDANGNLYATGANISGRLTVTGGNVYTKDETDNNLNNTVNEAINNIDNNVIYAYSANSDGANYSYDNSNLQYRGIFVTNQKDGINPIIPPEKHYEKTSDVELHEDKVYYELVDHEGVQEYIQVDNPSISDIDNYYEFINEEPNKFQWEINPIYAEQHASNYIADFQGGIKISAASNTTNAYLSLTAVLMQFWLNQRSMAQFGYDSIYESYGISVENVMITGAGNALRLDNGINGTYQGQFILETRSNGHLSLKPGLSRTEEEEI